MKKIVAIAMMCLLLLQLCACSRKNEVEVGNHTEYVRLSEEMVKKLPQEPDLQTNPSIWKEFQEYKRPKLLYEELEKRDGKAFHFVNEDGDIISDKISTDILKENRFYFRSIDNHLVEIILIQDNFYRQEYYLQTQIKNHSKWTKKSERINGTKKHYFQIEDKLYYYVKEGEIYKTIRLADGIETLVEGTCYQKNTGVAYPIFFNRGDIYVYTIQNAEPTTEYVYQIDKKIKEKMINLGEVEGSCKINGEYMEIDIGDYLLEISIDKNVKEKDVYLEGNLTQCYIDILRYSQYYNEECWLSFNEIYE